MKPELPHLRVGNLGIDISIAQLKKMGRKKRDYVIYDSNIICLLYDRGNVKCKKSYRVLLANANERV